MWICFEIKSHNTDLLGSLDNNIYDEVKAWQLNK
jgi:hypothetical protein